MNSRLIGVGYYQLNDEMGLIIDGELLGVLRPGLTAGDCVCK